MLRDKEFCYGCSACASVCPKDAIEMEVDQEGFSYPSVNKDKCITCGACETVCNEQGYRRNLGEAYIAQSLDAEILKRCTSGGIVPELSKRVIRSGGIVCSTVYHVSNGGMWKFVSSEDKLRDFSGSKYFQIPLTSSVIRTIKAELVKRPVLFIGTPCQVNAVNNRVKNTNSNNLYTIDLICGGTVSSKFEEKYIGYESNLAHKKIEKHYFRAKNQGWTQKYLTELVYEDGTRLERRGSDGLFTRAYSSGMFLRPSCYNCEFCNESRTGDITVGDCWGIGSDVPFDVSKGVSMIFANTSKGKELLDSISNVKRMAADRDKLIRENKPLYTKHRRKPLRNLSYGMINSFRFKAAVNICAYRYHIKRMLRRN